MDGRFQRKGAKSNTAVGRAFEMSAQEFFMNLGLRLECNIPVDIGITCKKPHTFDLGNRDLQVLVECKSHKWTESGNVPSAKVTTWDQAMFYFHVAPKQYRKIFFVLRDVHKQRKESLAEYYLRIKPHLIPAEVEIWEYNEVDRSGKRLK